MPWGMPARRAAGYPMLQSRQMAPTESLLTVLLNELATLPDDCILVLDDYHLIESQAIDDALTFLLEHMPPQLHLVIATRKDPLLPLPPLQPPHQQPSPLPPSEPPPHPKNSPP